MAVARMKKVTVVGYQADREKVVEALQSLGTMQIVDFKDAFQPEEASFLSPGTADSQATDSALQEVSYAIAFLDRHQSKEKGLIDSFVGEKVSVPVGDYQRAVTAFDYHAVYERCHSLDVRATEVKNQRAKILAQKEQISAWADLDMPLEQLRETDQVEVVAMVAAAQEIPRIEALLESSGGRYELVKVSSDQRQVYFVLFTLKGDKEVADALRSGTVSRVTFSDLRGTVAVNLARLESELSALLAQESEYRASVQELLTQYDDLLVLYDEMLASKSASSVQTQFGCTEQVFVVQGWVKEKQTEELTANMHSLSEALEVKVDDPTDGDTPPTSLENSKWSEPFEIVTTIYGLPGYNEADPTPLLAPFFFVYFGLALSDAAYGVILALASIWAIRKFNIPWSHKKMFRLMVFAGVSTVIFGSMLGSWFGDLFNYLPGPLQVLRQWRDSITLMDPIQDPISLLVVSLALGAIQIWYGIFVKMQATIKSSGLITGLLDQGSWLAFLASLFAMVLAGANTVIPKAYYPVTSNLALATFVILVFAQGRGASNIITKILTGLYAAYGGVAYFSDMLSYSRLLALGLATAVIGNVVNQMAQLVRPLPFIGPVLLLGVLLVGHTFNLAINILGSFIHAGRLQFVEFFTKFFEGGGRAFRPFARNNKYTVVKG